MTDTTTDQRRDGAERRTFLMGRRATDNRDNHLQWLQENYIDPILRQALTEAEKRWKETMRGVIAEELRRISKGREERDAKRDWRTARIAAGVAFIVCIVFFSIVKVNGG